MCPFDNGAECCCSSSSKPEKRLRANLLQTLKVLTNFVWKRPFVRGSAAAVPFTAIAFPAVYPYVYERYPNVASRFDPNPTMFWLIALNFLVCSAWNVRRVGRWSDIESFRKMGSFLKRHFTMCPDTVLSRRRWHTCITYMFSHEHPLHFVGNMLALYSFGCLFHTFIGRKLFMSLYLGTCECLWVHGLSTILTNLAEFTLQIHDVPKFMSFCVCNEYSCNLFHINL